MNTYYLYRHIRLDKNIPFYIGIGTKNEEGLNDMQIYNRAYRKHQRNKIWNRVVNKTNYKVEILTESRDLNFIYNKEIEFISLYGRMDLKTGTLANMTKGGDGSTGYEFSEEVLKKKSDFQKSRIRKKGYKVNLSIEGRKNKSDYMKNRVITDETKAIMSKVRLGNKFASGHKVSENVKNSIRSKMKCHIILQYDLQGIFIKEFPSLNYIKRNCHGQFDVSCIKRVCKGIHKQHNGFLWKYKI